MAPTTLRTRAITPERETLTHGTSLSIDLQGRVVTEQTEGRGTTDPCPEIPTWKVDPDHFVWDAFDCASRDARTSLDRDALQQEALLAETTSFYVVPDQFGVVDGHMLVLSKAPTSSIAGLDPSHDAELTWLLRHVRAVVDAAYGSQTVVAEHGECGCATADQAHVHVVPIPASTTRVQLVDAIDRTLRRRMIGVERVTYKDLEFTSPEDVRDLHQRLGAKAQGRVLRCADLTDGGPYPTAARARSALAQPYVYFSGPGVRFTTLISFRSQFVREVVATAIGCTDGSWDRRVRPVRDHMFTTYERLVESFAATVVSDHGYLPRLLRTKPTAPNLRWAG